ncbi:MAG: HAD family phosphatase [Candidatus Omnitrophota bacterium]
MIKAAIFDLGNVLINFDHRIAVIKIAPLCAMQEEEIYNFFFDSPLTGLFEEGKIDALEFFSEVKKSLQLKIGYDEFLPVWNEIFFLTESNRSVYGLAEKLRKKYKTALLSNINSLHFDYLRENFPIFGPFHNLLLSFEMKLKKPDAGIYKKTLETLGVLPHEAFYTDDRPELIESAAGLGIQAFVFKGVEQLKDDLLAAGVEIG